MPFATSFLAPLFLAVSQVFLGPGALYDSLNITMRGLTGSLAGGLALPGLVSGQACQTTTLRDSTPNDGSQVALGSYSYCGGSLDVTAYIANVNYNKAVNLYYTNRQDESTPLSVVGLNYRSSIGDDNTWELWGSSTPIYIDGITELLNITYRAVDIGQTYSEQLGFQVEASGAPEPSLPSPPAPYASPSADLSLAKMFVNINPAIGGADLGTVVAARSGPSYDQKTPDYEYCWVRDASLTMEVVEMLYAAATSSDAKTAYEDVLFEYSQSRATEQNADDLITGLGEPKFYLNNTAFTQPWGRPQNDGPATAAVTLMEFANAYLADGGSADTVRERVYDSTSYPGSAPVKKDLLFVANNWRTSSFDIWEEVQGDHFYNRMVQRRAMVTGADFATQMGDSETAATLSAEADAITATLDQFWDPNRKIILYEYGPVLREKSSYLDIAVVLAVIHGYAGDGVYSYTNDRIMSSALRISTSFLDVYPIAGTTQNEAGATIGIPVGRYPEDVYNGVGTEENGGNPWYLTTAAMAQFLYSATAEYNAAGSITVTDVSQPVFAYFAPDADARVGETYNAQHGKFDRILEGMNGWGDAFMRRIQYHAPADGRLAEEYDRDYGFAVGAADLTWSYASVLTAAMARARATGEDSYVEGLANIGFEPNA
ncbi:hypothetical protein MBLNU230_g3996t1 [Neophaeotheca triangularis]